MDQASQYLDVYLFRHGETDFNAEHRFQGNIDTTLNEEGRKQARLLAKTLKDKGIQVILSSPLVRAYETAEILAKDLQIKVITHHDLREIHCGDAEGRLRSEVIAQYGEDFWERWRSIKDCDMDLRFAGGESKRECQQRAIALIGSLVEMEPRYTSIGLAIHGAIMRYFMHSIIGDTGDPIPIPNCVVYLMRYHRPEQRWELIDCSHTVT